MPIGRGTVLQERPKNVVTFSRGTGLVVVGQVDNRPVKFLVDTGASITVISKANDDMTSGNLNPVEFEVVQVNGDPMPVMGQKVTEITLGPLRVSHQVVVADVKDDAILGIDFLTQHDCKLDLSSQLLTIQDMTINMLNEGDKMLLIYLDDIIIFASDFEEKMHRLRAVFDQICDAELKLKPAKCIFLQRGLIFRTSGFRKRSLHRYSQD